MKVKKGDQVKVLSGKFKGKISEVVAVYPRTEKVLVKDVNIVSQFKKSNPNSDKKGGIIRVEMPIHVSNVMVVNPETGKPSRIGYVISKDGKKERIFKSNSKVSKPAVKKEKSTESKETKVKAAKTSKVKESKTKSTSKTK
jgi:large subunit ribosomal protein L24